MLNGATTPNVKNRQPTSARRYPAVQLVPPWCLKGDVSFRERFLGAKLIFTACRPVLTVEARTALTLRLICGPTTAEIARAFLVPEKPLAQRILSKAKGRYKPVKVVRM